jgi:hypothetical protein
MGDIVHSESEQQPTNQNSPATRAKLARAAATACDWVASAISFFLDPVGFSLDEVLKKVFRKRRRP